MVIIRKIKKAMFDSLIHGSKYLWFKIVGSLLAVAGVELIAITDEHQRAIKALAILMLIDSILGVWTAIKMKRFASWRMGQPMARKVILYSIAGVSVFAFAGAFDSFFNWAPAYIIMFFSISEILSIFEKLSLLGLQLPIRLVSKLNEAFQKMAYGDEEAKKTILEKK